MTQTILLAAGGTGGHIFPALATAEMLQARGLAVAFFTDPRFHDYVNEADLPFVVTTLHIPRPRGGLFGKLHGLWRMACVSFSTTRAMVKVKPSAVIGYGGYPTFPTLAAARILGVPIILHEQNALMGKVNRLFMRPSQAIALSFPQVSGTERYSKKTHVTGNPVRGSIHYRAKNGPTPPIRMLVTGGSQGARVFTEKVPEAVALLPAFLRAQLQVHQQCAEASCAQLQQQYDALGVFADIQPFFSDMDTQLQQADLVMGRSGASTVAELAIAGRASVLVPLPSAAEDHQTYNAMQLVEEGAAILIPQADLSADFLAKILEDLLQHPEKLAVMGTHARQLANAQAANHLSDVVLRVIA